MAYADRVELFFERLRQEMGGVAGTYAVARGTTTNTKAIPATDCVRMYLAREAGEGLGRDRCVFLILASAFASGFSAENPVTPAAGQQYTPTGETAWIVQAASLRGAGAYYRLDAVRDRVGWDSA